MLNKFLVLKFSCKKPPSDQSTHCYHLPHYHQMGVASAPPNGPIIIKRLPLALCQFNSHPTANNPLQCIYPIYPFSYFHLLPKFRTVQAPSTCPPFLAFNRYSVISCHPSPISGLHLRIFQFAKFCKISTVRVLDTSPTVSAE